MVILSQSTLEVIRNSMDKKFKIKEIDGNKITLGENIDSDILKQKPRRTLAKDDVSPQDIFRLQDGSADDRKTIAVYCIQDCELCNNLIDKLKIVTNQHWWQMYVVFFILPVLAWSRC